MSIPAEDWVWCGYPGHFVAAHDCLLRLNTRVGDYRISTVGDYRPGDAVQPQEIGLARFYETYVFKVEGHGEHGEGEVADWTECDAEAYTTYGEAERGHMEMCRKYAEVHQ